MGDVPKAVTQPAQTAVEQAAKEPLEGAAREFHMTEYEALRAEILAHSSSVMMMAQYAVAASAAVYVFLIVSKPQGALGLPETLLKWAMFLPVLFALAGGHLSNQQHRRMREIGGYLRKLEDALARPGLGWERRLHQAEERPDDVGFWGLTGAWLHFWAGLLFVTIVMGWLALKYDARPSFPCCPALLI